MSRRPRCQVCGRKATKKLRFPGSPQPILILCARCTREMGVALKAKGMKVIGPGEKDIVVDFEEAYHGGEQRGPTYGEMDQEIAHFQDEFDEIEGRAREIIAFALQDQSSVLAVWELPEGDYPAWQAFTGYGKPSCWELYQYLVKTTSEIGAIEGVKVVGVRWTVAEMKAKLEAAALTNTPLNRAKVLLASITDEPKKE